jgi:tetratricopeptide (TPR) repeat protein
MVEIPHDLWPSSLLWTDELCPAARDYTENCCRFGENEDPRLLGIWEREAEAMLRSDKRNDWAIVLIYLADLHRICNELAEALRCSQEADRWFCTYPQERHTHNRAVALYAVGLVQYYVGNYISAVQSYDKALTELHDAKEIWTTKSHSRMLQKCIVAIRWIEKRRDGIAHTRSATRRGQVPIPIRSVSLLMKAEEFEHWQDIDERDAVRVSFAGTCDSMTGEGIQDGDIVLIEERQDAPPGRGRIVAVLDPVENEITLKKLYQEADHTRLEPANDAYPFIIFKSDLLPRRVVKALYPGRMLHIKSGTEPQIFGWYRGKA